MISFFNAINTYTDASMVVDRYGKKLTCAGFATVYHGQVIDHGVKIVHNVTNNYGEILAIYMGIANLLSYKENDAFLNLFSDSQISVSGLKEWIYSWVRDMDRNTMELKNSTGVKVANQEIFMNIVNYIISNDTHLSIWHQRGHKDPAKVAEMEEVRKTFMTVNETEITDDIIREICYYNDMVDHMTRNHLVKTVEAPDYNPLEYAKPKIICSRVLNWDIMPKYRDLIS